MTAPDLHAAYVGRLEEHRDLLKARAEKAESQLDALKGALGEEVERLRGEKEEYDEVVAGVPDYTLDEREEAVLLSNRCRMEIHRLSMLIDRSKLTVSDGEASGKENLQIPHSKAVSSPPEESR